MSKETLHKLRLLIPGMIFFIILVPFLQGTQRMLELKIPSDSISYFVVVFVIGVLVYVINPRMWIMKKPLKRVVDNIKDKLLAPFSMDTKILESTDNLRDGDKLTNIFYFFVDNEKSLEERAKEVYLNGLIWSTLADLTIISPVAILVYLIAYIFTHNNHFLVLVGIAILVLLLSVVSLPAIVNRHIRLSNYQLSYITENLKTELHNKIMDLLDKTIL